MSRHVVGRCRDDWILHRGDAGRHGSPDVTSKRRADNCCCGYPTAPSGAGHPLQAQGAIAELRIRRSIESEFSSDGERETAGPVYEPHIPQFCRTRKGYRGVLVQFLELRVRAIVSQRWPSCSRSAADRSPLGRARFNQFRDPGRTGRPATRALFYHAVTVSAEHLRRLGNRSPTCDQQISSEARQAHSRAAINGLTDPIRASGPVGTW